MKNFDVAAVERKIGYTFKDKNLLRQAFVLSSYANIESLPDNERMEFFGDAILECIVSEYIFNKFPHFNQGKLSQLRSSVVSAKGLRPVVDKLDIKSHVLVVGALPKKLEANLYEALICAIFFDGGMEQAKDFVLRTLQQHIDFAAQNLLQDFKTVVQEYCQQRQWTVEYREESKSGPDNNPVFTCSLWVNGQKVSSGSGSRKQFAEQDAASKIVKIWRIDQCFI